MTDTPHLALPLLAAAQAQKHVTHNEALFALDALVHLAVKESGRTHAPASPTEGDRYLVGAGASGAFASHDGEIALFDLGIWRFFAPRPGWRTYVEAEDKIAVFDGFAWRDLGHYSRDLGRVERLGIGAAPDNLNRFTAKLNAALFAAMTSAEGGTGDLRFVLNKGEAINVLSQLYQRGFSGRAEAGLIGTDDFSIRVSPDGNQWHDALLVDRNTGLVSFPSGFSGAPQPNLLVNSAFLVNQRAFGGGPLAAGAYGFDRWKAGTGGCSLARAADGTVTLTGTLDQVIDVAQAVSSIGAINFAGRVLTLSVEDPPTALPVMIGAKVATIPAGLGRRSATVTLDAGETGHVTVRLQPSGACAFKRVKLEIGPGATPWIGQPLEIEEFRCRRYYQTLAAGSGSPVILCALGQRVSSGIVDVACALPVPMRANPTVATSGFSWANGSPINNQVGFFDNAAGAWVSMAGGLTVTMATTVGPFSGILRFQAGVSFTGAAGAVGNLHLGGSAFIALQAEL
jgi:hypothetical protein